MEIKDYTLGEICLIISGKDMKKYGNSESGIPVLFAGNIKDGEIKEGGKERFIDTSKVKEKLLFIRKEDIVISAVGESIGKLGINLTEKIVSSKERLNKEQLKAVQASLDKNVLITAGAGTGKTKTLVERYKYLIQNNIDKEKILVTTFTGYARNVIEERLLEEFLRTDFLPKKVCSILEDNEFLRKKYLLQYEYILFDEFQDIDIHLYKILRIFVRLGGKVFVVGDPNQSIYEFRSSMKDPFEKFRVDFIPFNSVELNLNYRSTEDIIRYANNLISHNYSEILKNPLISNLGPGEEVEVIHRDNKYELEEFILPRLKVASKLKAKLVEQGFYKNTGNLNSLREKIREINIPVVLIELFFSLLKILCRKKIEKLSIIECLDVIDKDDVLDRYKLRKIKTETF
ncbi:hypothetical protein PVNG_02335 [Plasmodium vivax North Korean]|uniref:DNA 3'-5' helicase n=1 Tax=Plasmodium vivax North Korean TaxID=1035514 RepID=A0A0J9TN61_PLAVI|nr:hypothetical protein PVNG_02335 [Plasmodium vivax North Korean]